MRTWAHAVLAGSALALWGACSSSVAGHSGGDTGDGCEASDLAAQDGDVRPGDGFAADDGEALELVDERSEPEATVAELDLEPEEAGGPDVCQPACAGKVCGDDGCGGTCPPGCGLGEACPAGGKECTVCPAAECDPGATQCWSDKKLQECVDQCTLTPECGVCGQWVPGQSCAANQECAHGMCICSNAVCDGTCCQSAAEVCLGGSCCLPDCGGKVCGDDGCGGLCAPGCPEWTTCVGSACGVVEQCPPGDCTPGELKCLGPKQPAVCVDACPADPECDCPVWQAKGACPANGACEQGVCVCTMTSCNGVCCQEATEVCADGACCQPGCAGKECGDDGCGGTCGACELGIPCTNGLCCQPACEGKECGPDGCGGKCGTCPNDVVCLDGKCGAYFGIADPPTVGCKYFDGPAPDITVKFDTLWSQAVPGETVIACFLDGSWIGEVPFPGEQTGSLTVLTVPVGQHQICCHVQQPGDPAYTEGSFDCACVRVKGPCNGPTDAASCDDGNPCSLQQCTGESGKFECHYGQSTDPGCCTSWMECPMVFGKPALCSGNKCQACQDEWCDDGEMCTKDKCVKGVCTNEWMTDATGANCCHAGMLDPGSVCDDGKFCTVDYCDLTAQHCVSQPSGDPACCDADTDPVCNDGDPCTLDKCISHECRHGPVADKLCCNELSDCDDGSPCTDDACVDNHCQFVPNGKENCCAAHADCGPDGPWDDGDPCTIDYCNDNQCQHAANPACCTLDGQYPCLDDGNPCTHDDCLGGFCVHPKLPGCCVTAADCKDGDPCTQDLCVDDMCQFQPVLKCCKTDQGCDDGNPCNLDKCVNHLCHHGPNPYLTDCCTTDADCKQKNCTTVYCNLDQHQCKWSLIPNHDPPCCWDATGCDDWDPLTKNVCTDNECSFPSGGACPAGLDSQCDDQAPCTQDVCDKTTLLCKYTNITLCCLKDETCSLPGYTDGDPQTKDTCNPLTHQCTFTLKKDFCTSNLDCPDDNPCNYDLCLGGQCKWIKVDQECCTKAADCKPASSCLTASCKQNQCQYTVDTTKPTCCTASADCDDADPCTDEYCDSTKKMCVSQPVPGC